MWSATNIVGKHRKMRRSTGDIKGCERNLGRSSDNGKGWNKVKGVKQKETNCIFRTSVKKDSQLVTQESIKMLNKTV